MTPKQYREKYRPNVSNLVKKLGISRNHFYWICRGNPAGKQLARKLEQITKGIISRNEAMFPEEYEEKQA